MEKGGKKGYVTVCMYEVPCRTLGHLDFSPHRNKSAKQLHATNSHEGESRRGDRTSSTNFPSSDSFHALHSRAHGICLKRRSQIAHDNHGALRGGGAVLRKEYGAVCLDSSQKSKYMLGPPCTLQNLGVVQISIIELGNLR